MPPPPLLPLAPGPAMEAFHRGAISATALARSLVGHGSWSLPVSERAMEDTLSTGSVSALMASRDDLGRSSLFAFSDAAAYAAYRASTGDSNERSLLTVPGTWVCGLSLEEFDYLVFDPGTPAACTYPRGALDSLRAMAAALEVEAALSEWPAASERALGAIRAYQDFLPVTRTVGGRPEFVTVPNASGGPCVVVCTARDAFMALASAGKYADVEAHAMGGELLFEMLAHEPMVINPAGPAGPIELPADFSDRVL